MILEANDPEPVPSLVLVDRLTVGFCCLLQTIPRAVTDAPPSLVMLPPDTAELLVMDETEVVDNIGTTEPVVNFTELPYDTPAELIAYART